MDLLRQVGVDLANSMTLPRACNKVEIVEQTYYRDQLKVAPLGSSTRNLATTSRPTTP